jgi:hypothetical protein
MAFDDARGVTVLFGGLNDANGEFLGDTWEWNGESWRLRATDGPTPRKEHAMAYDAERGVTVLFGGRGGADETWEWDGDRWAISATTGPTARARHAMAYDSARGFTVMFGGDDDDTWEYGRLCVRDPAWGCDGDVDGNGVVNPVDVGIVQAFFGNTNEDNICQYDLDCIGAINPVDAGLVQSLFGLCNAPRPVCP